MDCSEYSAPPKQPPSSISVAGFARIQAIGSSRNPGAPGSSFLPTNRRFKILNGVGRGLAVVLPLALFLLVIVGPVRPERLADAATTVVANRSNVPVRFQVDRAEGEPASLSLEPDQLVPLPVTGLTRCGFTIDGRQRQYDLRPNAVYFFALTESGQLDLQQVELGGGSDSRKVVERGGVDWPETGKIGVVRIKVLVDDDDARRRETWEPKIRKRVEAASKILEYFCRLRLQIVAVDMWESDNTVRDFKQSLQDFAESVPRSRADLVIGFTSQYALSRRMAMLGVTRGPLDSHILIREYGPRVSEGERLEVLLHEVGHFLGAAHSLEKSSLMRPVLADGQVNSRRFRIAFDAINTLAMNLISEAWRRDDVRRLDKLPGPALSGLAQIYQLLADSLPKDPAAAEMLAMLRARTNIPADGEAAAEQSPLQNGVHEVVKAVLLAAKSNREATQRDGKKPTGDQLTALYIRAAAAAARRSPPEQAVQSFLLGLGIALDRDGQLKRVVPQANIAETDEAQRRRLQWIGQPTVRGRTDLTQHFIALSILTATAGPTSAEAAGLLKEMYDAQYGTGFSFADLAANMAGIRFTRSLLSNEITLEDVHRDFSVARFVPAVDDLAEGLSAEAFQERYGSPYSARCRDELKKIRERIAALKGYQR